MVSVRVLLPATVYLLKENIKIQQSNFSKFLTTEDLLKNCTGKKQCSFSPCLLKASRSVFIYQGVINTPFARDLHTNVKALETCSYILPVSI